MLLLNKHDKSTSFLVSLIMDIIFFQNHEKNSEHLKHFYESGEYFVKPREHLLKCGEIFLNDCFSKDMDIFVHMYIKK